MTLREQQSRKCIDCGVAFYPALRHPNQKTCGGGCKKSWRRRSQHELAKRKDRYWSDPDHRAARIAHVRKMTLKRVYGVTMEQYLEMLSKQDGKCAICGLVPGTGQKALCVDHDHESKRVRDLLCVNCNIAIGNLKEDPERARSAAAYLEKWKCS